MAQKTNSIGVFIAAALLVIAIAFYVTGRFNEDSAAPTGVEVTPPAAQPAP